MQNFVNSGAVLKLSIGLKACEGWSKRPLEDFELSASHVKALNLLKFTLH